MSDGTGDLKLDYVDFPVYAKVQVPTPGVSPFGYLGPQVWFEVTCKVDDVRCTGGDPNSRRDHLLAAADTAGDRPLPRSGNIAPPRDPSRSHPTS